MFICPRDVNMADVGKVENAKVVQNTLLSGAGVTFPYEQFHNTSLLVPVPAQVQPVLLEDEGQVDKFVGQEPEPVKPAPTAAPLVDERPASVTQKYTGLFSSFFGSSDEVPPPADKESTSSTPRSYSPFVHVPSVTSFSPALFVPEEKTQVTTNVAAPTSEPLPPPPATNFSALQGNLYRQQPRVSKAPSVQAPVRHFVPVSEPLAPPRPATADSLRVDVNPVDTASSTSSSNDSIIADLQAKYQSTHISANPVELTAPPVHFSQPENSSEQTSTGRNSAALPDTFGAIGHPVEHLSAQHRPDIPTTQDSFFHEVHPESNPSYGVPLQGFGQLTSQVEESKPVDVKPVETETEHKEFYEECPRRESDNSRAEVNFYSKPNIFAASSLKDHTFPPPNNPSCPNSPAVGLNKSTNTSVLAGSPLVPASSIPPSSGTTAGKYRRGIGRRLVYAPVPGLSSGAAQDSGLSQSSSFGAPPQLFNPGQPAATSVDPSFNQPTTTYVNPASVSVATEPQQPSYNPTPTTYFSPAAVPDPSASQPPFLNPASVTHGASVSPPAPNVFDPTSVSKPLLAQEPPEVTSYAAHTPDAASPISGTAILPPSTSEEIVLESRDNLQAESTATPLNLFNPVTGASPNDIPSAPATVGAFNPLPIAPTPPSTASLFNPNADVSATTLAPQSFFEDIQTGRTPSAPPIGFRESVLNPVPEPLPTGPPEPAGFKHSLFNPELASNSPPLSVAPIEPNKPPTSSFFGSSAIDFFSSPQTSTPPAPVSAFSATSAIDPPPLSTAHFFESSQPPVQPTLFPVPSGIPQAPEPSWIPQASSPPAFSPPPGTVPYPSQYPNQPLAAPFAPVASPSDFFKAASPPVMASPPPGSPDTLNPVDLSSSPRPARSPSPSVVPQRLLNLGQSGLIYRPPYYHWFWNNQSNDTSDWQPFSMTDSMELEEVFNSGNLTMDSTVATDGGRYDVALVARRRESVYWTEPAREVWRCSWFRKPHTSQSKPVPYDENTALLLEEEYKAAVMSATWQRKVTLEGGEYVVMYGPMSIAHYMPSTPASAWEATTDGGTSQRLAWVVKRNVEDFEIDDGESPVVDHLLFVVHGIGSVCDLKFRTIENALNDFRTIANQLVRTHYRTSIDRGEVNRVEILPVSWHQNLHDECGVDDKMKQITLKSIPKLRHFTNDTLLDILFYTSPVYCQRIMDQVGQELNRKFELFKTRNPSFQGNVSLAGHSLGSLILFDLLCHQKQPKAPTAADIVDPDKALSRTASYTTGSAGTGQPFIIYPKLQFQPNSFFAMGSPIGMFVTVRGIDSLGLDFRLPTCPGLFNIFHPFDPVAYRLEALINPDLANQRPVLIPHHKGRKRMHLELRETMARVGADLKQRVVDTVKSTWQVVYQLTSFGRSEEAIRQEVDEAFASQMAARERTESTCEEESGGVIGAANGLNVGVANQGRRVDYVLQEAPLESFNEYVSAITSHVCYWDSEDTALFILKDIYNNMGVAADSPAVIAAVAEEAAEPPSPPSPDSFVHTPLARTDAPPLPMGVDPTAPMSSTASIPAPPMSGFVRK